MSEVRTFNIQRHVVTTDARYRNELQRPTLIQFRRDAMRNELGGKVMEYITRIPGCAAEVFFHESEHHEGKFLVLKATAQVRPREG